MGDPTLPPPGVALIPLRRRDGSVRAWALVDEDLFEELSQFRWCLGSAGYACRWIYRPRKTHEWLHRRVLGLGLEDPRSADHINGNPLDNRRCNLRACTHAENHQNRRGARVDSRTGVRGVGLHRQSGKFRARVKVNGRQHCGGLHATIAEAEAAAIELRRRLMPFSEMDQEGGEAS